jgi:hypothetical protein
LATQLLPGLCLTAFALLGLYMVLGAGSFDLDSDRITHQSRLGKWQILWNDVTNAEFGSAGTLVLIGNDKHFILSQPNWWSVPQKNAAINVVKNELRARNISPQLNRVADYKRMKNTCVVEFRRTA